MVNKTNRRTFVSFIFNLNMERVQMGVKHFSRESVELRTRSLVLFVYETAALSRRSSNCIVYKGGRQKGTSHFFCILLNFFFLYLCIFSLAQSAEVMTLTKVFYFLTINKLLSVLIIWTFVELLLRHV